MRRGGSKSKGSHFELENSRRIAEAFSMFGVHPDDCYRTKNSGATKAQPGDLQFSPKLAKLFPAVIECKHYRTLLYKIGRPLTNQPDSYPIVSWIKQLIQEERDTTGRFGLLIVRENNSNDLAIFTPENVSKIIGHKIPFKTYMFSRVMITQWRGRVFWFVPLSEFLTMYCFLIKWVLEIPIVSNEGT